MRFKKALLPRFALFFAVALPLWGQAPVGYITSIKANPQVVAPGGPPYSTVTVTVAPVSGPVSALDGMSVDIAGSGAVITNGTASATFEPYTGGRPLSVLATFPAGVPYGSGSTARTTIAVRPTPFVSALLGDFAFTVKSYADNGGKRGGESVSAGTLKFDAYGKVTGEMDFNGPLGTLAAASVTGTYSIDGNALGKLTLETSGGTQHFDFFAGVGQINYFNHITQAAMTETDGPLLAGSGVLVQRTPAIETVDLLFQLDGTVDCGTCPRSAFPTLATLTGSVDYDQVSIVLDQSLGTFVQKGVAGTGRLAYVDDFGRFTLHMTTPNQPSQQPSNFVGYVVDASRIFMLSTDPVATTVLFSGTGSAP